MPRTLVPGHTDAADFDVYYVAEGDKYGHDYEAKADSPATVATTLEDRLAELTPRNLVKAGALGSGQFASALERDRTIRALCRRDLALDRLLRGDLSDTDDT